MGVRFCVVRCTTLRGSCKDGEVQRKGLMHHICLQNNLNSCPPGNDEDCSDLNVCVRERAFLYVNRHAMAAKERNVTEKD